MADLRPFRGVRPRAGLADRVAAPPYDVVDSGEARRLAEGNPCSFLHINKPEIDLEPDLDPHDMRVYRKGAENLRRFLDEGIIRRDEQPHYYVYRQVMGAHQQTGLVAVASVDEYERDLIKKHEYTRPDKETDRVNHIDQLDAQVGPVFLTYRSRGDIDTLIERCTAQAPGEDFTVDGVRHMFWVVRDEQLTRSIREAFSRVPCLYVADGHHRSAAAERVRRLRREANPNHDGSEPYNYFLAVVFPHDQMQVLDYNRVVKDLRGMSPAAFIDRLAADFEVEPVPDGASAKPRRAHDFGMYLDGCWYRLRLRDGRVDESDPVARLDVSILQERVLAPLLDIGDPRTDERVDFVGGIRGMAGLQQRVDGGGWAAAFACYPTSLENLMAIADAGRVMPPKSTWFEPKLKTGLVIHMLDSGSAG